MNFSFKRPEDSPGFLLWQLTNQWQRQQRQALASLRLTHGQFVVLAGVLWLSHQSTDVVTQQQVSLMTAIDKMSMSDLVVSLVRKKMLKRMVNRQDKRAYALALTEKGKQVVLKAIPIVEGVDAVFFSQDTPNVVQLIKTLKAIV